jgi:TPR repeat protein
MNHTEAAQNYKLAADQNSAVGKLSCGVCRSVGKGVEQNVRQAIAYLRRSAGQGCLLARIKLDYFMSLCKAAPSPIHRTRSVPDFAMNFDDMTIVAVLGKGGYGVVKLLEDRFMKQRIAVKYLNDASGRKAAS